jgi:hypothetical protein
MGGWGTDLEALLNGTAVFCHRITFANVLKAAALPISHLSARGEGVISDNPRNALFGCIRVHPTIADVDPIPSDEHHAAARTARGKGFIGRAVHDHTQSATFRSCCPDSAERHLGTAVLLQAYQWIAGSRMKRRKCLDYLHDPLTLDRCHSITKGLNPAKAIDLITLAMECPRLDIQGHAHMTLLPRNEAQQCNLSPCSENATFHAAEAESAREDIDVHRHVSSIDERNPRP